jgi:hypothetical protein
VAEALPAGAVEAVVRRSGTADFAAVRAAARQAEVEAARLPIALHNAGAGTDRLFNQSTAVAQAAEIPGAASPAAVLQFNPSQVLANRARGIRAVVNPAQANRRLRSREIQGPDQESRDRIGQEPANPETGLATGRVMEIGPEMATNQVDPAKAIARAIDPATATDPADREKATDPELGLVTVIVPANPERAIAPAIDPADREKVTAPELGLETVIVRANPEKVIALAIDRADREKATVLAIVPTDPEKETDLGTGPETDLGIGRAIAPITAIGQDPAGLATPTIRAADRRTGTDIGRTCITPGTTGTGMAIGITAARIGTPIRGAPGALPRAPSG